jgi:hypothetical protein
MHLIVLLHGVGQLEAPFGLFGDSVNLDVRSLHGLHRMSNRLKNHFGHTRWNAKVTWVKWQHASGYMEAVLISTSDWCTVCVESTTGMETILALPGGPPR